jgi:hypothetical protein
MRGAGKIFAVVALILFAAGCKGAGQPKSGFPPADGHNRTTAPAPPEPTVKIKSIVEGDWNIDTNPLLAWEAAQSLGEIQFASVQIFEIVDGKPAQSPCVTIDDMSGEMARSNGGRLFDRLDGVMICFMGSHAGAEQLKPATRYFLVLTLVGSKAQGSASVKFITQQRTTQ